MEQRRDPPHQGHGLSLVRHRRQRRPRVLVLVVVVLGLGPAAAREVLEVILGELRGALLADQVLRLDIAVKQQARVVRQGRG